MGDVSAFKSLYSQPGIDARVGGVLEAIFERRGPFAKFPPSPFETFQMKVCEANGLDYRTERRLYFEAVVAGPGVTGSPSDPAINQAFHYWFRTFNLAQPPYAGSHGNLRPKQVRTLLDQLAGELVLPEGVEAHVDRDGYSWEVQQEDADWEFVLGASGHFSRGGYTAFASAFVQKLDPWECHGFPLFNAFMDIGGPLVTIEEFANWHRHHAHKVKAVLDYLRATAVQNS